MTRREQILQEYGSLELHREEIKQYALLRRVTSSQEQEKAGLNVPQKTEQNTELTSIQESAQKVEETDTPEASMLIGN